MRVREAPPELRDRLAVIAAVPADGGRSEREEKFVCAGCGSIVAAERTHFERRGAAAECSRCRTLCVPAFRNAP